MKKINLLFAVLFISFLAVGTGNVLAQNIETKDYFRGMPINTIVATGPFHVSLRSSEDTHVKLASIDNKDVEITCKSGKVIMNYKGKEKGIVILVSVYLPNLKEVSLDKGATFTTDETIAGGSVDFTLKGNSQVTDLQLNAKSIDFTIKEGTVKATKVDAANVSVSVANASLFEGSIPQAKKTSLKADVGSRIEIKGASKSLDIKASAASNINCSDFQVKEASVFMEGACTANLNVSESLEVELNTASSVKYKGNAVIKKEKLSPRATVTKE